MQTSTLPSPTSASAVDAPGRSAVAGTVGFKDWALVCAALGQGRQSLILRKGGIAEGRAGFRFKHAEFFLFPTQYHEQGQKVRAAELAGLQPATPARDGQVEIRYFFRLEWAVWLDEPAALARLEPFHVWGPEVLRERFAYGEQPGLQCAFGRVYRLASVWVFPDRPAYGGCRSWVTLPELPEGIDLQPVLGESEHQQIAAAALAALSPP